MFWPKGGCLAYSSTNLLNLSIIFPNFFTTLCMWRLPHSSIAHIPWCVCTNPIDLMGIHLLCCVHSNKHIRTHDGIDDTFVAIVWDVGFQVGWEQLHALPSTTFNSSCRWVDIVFTKYDIHTLTNVIIVNPTWVGLLPHLVQLKDLSLLM
jgi:hypothetical protein